MVYFYVDGKLEINEDRQPQHPKTSKKTFFTKGTVRRGCENLETVFEFYSVKMFSVIFLHVIWTTRT